jgi:5'-phosphate synthase pdxT subunit
VADDGVTPLVFIRAPRIRRVGTGVHVLATLAGEPVMVQQGDVTGATFHPELAASIGQLHRRIFAPSIS